MDCRTCQPSLIDLLHGELALEAAEQVRAHIAHCTNCKGALDKLAQGLQHARQLPLADPPQAVTARLLQLADEQAKRAVAARKPRGAPTVWQGLLDFVGRMAAARQVGMVTIMLLIVAVGLWSLPQLKHTPIAAGGTVVHPDESGEAAPSTGVEPAEPLDLKVDLRAGRIRSRDEAPALVDVPAIAAEQPYAVDPAAPPGGDAQRAARPARSAGALDKEAARAAEAGGGLASARELRQARKPSAAAPAPFPRNSDAKKSAASKEERDAEPLAAVSPAPAAAPAFRDDLLEASVRGRAEGESSAGPPQTSKQASGRAAVSPALTAARSTAATRGCMAAVPEYERAVREAPTSPAAGEALIEMARCVQARDAQRARALLARAAQIPQVARRASDMLARIPAATPREAKGKGEPSVEAEDAPLGGLED